MQSGFNTNYRHRGVLFHVQTEDSGVANPHVITHLFHGGNIIASTKRDYRDKLDAADIEAEVRGLMESQHREMLRQLSRGFHDRVILERLGKDALSGPGGGPPPPPDPEPDTLPPPAESPTAAEGLPPGRAAAAKPEGPRDRLARAFGDGIVSDKPLDEVVLDYLVENARKRKRSSG